MHGFPQAWDELPAGARRAMERAVSLGVPAASLAFYARWWQLETWLRQLAYIELRAAFGRNWLTKVQEAATGRAERDEVNSYMRSPDAANVLAYLDVGYLFRIIDHHWHCFEHALVPRNKWNGVVDELVQLRHRNAHCRRPHRDDLARLEQTLRDLEPGARSSMVAYNDELWVEPKLRDPVVTAWLEERHADAGRLVAHAERQYETRFQLGYSRRPWATPQKKKRVSGAPGYIWRATWVMFGGRFLEPAALWSTLTRPGIRDQLIHVLQNDPISVTVTLPAVDDPAEISDAIGACFDAVLMSSRPNVPSQMWDDWPRGVDELDPRVQASTAISLASPDAPFLFFEANRDVE